MITDDQIYRLFPIESICRRQKKKIAISQIMRFYICEILSLRGAEIIVGKRSTCECYLLSLYPRFEEGGGVYCFSSVRPSFRRPTRVAQW